MLSIISFTLRLLKQAHISEEDNAIYIYKKSEPSAYRLKVRISHVWWSQQDSKRKWVCFLESTEAKNVDFTRVF